MGTRLPNPQHGGDNMALYAWHQQLAIDMLFNNHEERPDQFGNVRAVKEQASIANQLGRERALSETCGAAGWELTFEDMKRLGDWKHTLGVNFMNQRLAYINLAGERKHDFPQGISYQTPWWDHYKVLNDYFGRLSVALLQAFIPLSEKRQSDCLFRPVAHGRNTFGTCVSFGKFSS
ncbi:MAG: hypothetical protein U5R06_14680 [candidate division KSB1 bacterium]|nr:hypothetical protein [candidate division KSB1 bacterium]